jgi:hypothetical protein
VYVMPITRGHRDYMSSSTLRIDSPALSAHDATKLIACIDEHMEHGVGGCTIPPQLIPDAVARTLPPSVVSFAYQHPDEVVDLAPAYLLLLANLAAGEFPNIVPCLGPIELHNSTDDDSTEQEASVWASIGAIAASSSRMSACARSGIPLLVDVSEPAVLSIMAFSSVNVAYVLVTALWISATFALRRFGEWTHKVCVAWLVVHAIQTLVWGIGSHHPIPLNNVLVALLALGVTTGVLVQGDHDSGPGDLLVPMGLQLMQYIITAPLYYVVVLAALSPSVMVVELQLMAVVTGAAYASLYVVVQYCQFCENPLESKRDDPSSFTCVLLMGCSSMMLKIGGITLFLLVSVRSQEGYVATHTNLFIAAILLVGMDLACYLVCLYDLVALKGSRYTSYQGFLWWGTHLRALCQALFLCMKGVVASLVMIALYNHELPAYACSVWEY